MYPWHEQSWDRINQVRLQGRMPHALLLLGPDGSGRQAFAERLAAALLCLHPAQDGRACGTCSACGWLRAGTHPDRLDVQPVETGKVIKVDQVRDLSASLAKSSHGDRYKVAIIQPAEAMNANAANGLLKTLEEPTDNTLIILVAASTGRLPATVRSRCQLLPTGMPDLEQAVAWLGSQGIDDPRARQALAVTGGAPLAALSVHASGQDELCQRRFEELRGIADGRIDPVTAAADWSASDMQETLAWLQGWLQEMIRGQAGAGSGTSSGAKLRQLAESVDCRQVFELHDRVVDARNQAGSGLNKQLLMEDLLIAWARLARPSRRRSVQGI